MNSTLVTLTLQHCRSLRIDRLLQLIRSGETWLNVTWRHWDRVVVVLILSSTTQSVLFCHILDNGLCQRQNAIVSSFVIGTGIHGCLGEGNGGRREKRMTEACLPQAGTLNTVVILDTGNSVS